MIPRIESRNTINQDELSPAFVSLLHDPDLYENMGFPIPDYLDTRWCKPSAIELMNSFQYVPHMSEKQIKAREAELQLMKQDPVLGKIYDVIDEIHQLNVASNVAGERARNVNLVYTEPGNPNSETMKFGQIYYGQHTEVNVPTGFSKEGFVLFDMHTHPHNLLFSPEDYQALITDFYSLYGSRSRKRLLNATMVLCPHNQFIAIASKDTPVLPYLEAEEYVRSIKQTTHEAYREAIKKESLDTDTKEEERIFADIVKTHRTELLHLIEQHKVALQSGAITPEERIKQYLDFISSTGDQGRQIVTAERKRNLIQSRIRDAQLWNIAKDLQLHLYTSDNLEDFYLQKLT